MPHIKEYKMVNWSLQPPEEPVVPEVVEEAEATTEVTEVVEEAPPSMEEVLKRLSDLEQANKNANSLANDLKRSVGRVQSIVDRLDKASGSTKADLEALLDERLNEVSTILDDVAGNIDDAILPSSVKEKVRGVRAQAAQRSAAVNIDKLVAEKLAQLLPQPQTSSTVPQEWRAFEVTMEKQIRDAGLNPDDSSIFDWQYAGALLAQGRNDVAEKYFTDIIDEHTTNAKLQEKKNNAPKSPTGGAVATPKQWWEQLDDPKVPMEEKLKIMRDQKLL